MADEINNSENTNEVSNTIEIPESINKILEKVFKEEKVNDIAQDVIIKLIDKIIKVQINKNISNHAEAYEDKLSKNENKYNSLQISLKNIWQDDFSKNMTYAKRAMGWLKLETLVDDDLNHLVDFFNRLLNLGKILSEDNLHYTSKTSSSLNKEEALQKRRLLTENKDNLAILSNKGHYMHKALLSELSALNTIIAKR